MAELLRFLALEAAFGLQSTPKIIYHRQKFSRDVSYDAIMGFATVALNTLAVIFKIGLAPRGRVLGLGKRSLQSLQLCPRRDQLRQFGPSDSWFFGLAVPVPGHS